MGHSLYFPFPYRRHCTITADSIQTVDPFTGKTLDRLFFQIGYRTYGADQAPARPLVFRRRARPRPAPGSNAPPRG